MSDLKHLIVLDIKRLVADLGRAPSRDEYILKGKISRRKLVNEFGTFTNALNAAGCYRKIRIVKPDFLEQKIANYQSTKQVIANKYIKEIKPYAMKYTGRESADLLLAQMSDSHSHYLDPFCRSVWLDTIKRVQPNIIIFGGDNNDWPELSKFLKDPTRLLTLQDELDFNEKMLFEPTREACPDAEIHYVLGNHEWRLFKYLCSDARALSSLRSLQFDNLMNLKKYRINLVARESFLTAKSEKSVNNFIRFRDCYIFSHGTRLGKFPAAAEMSKFGKSGASGHVHRHQVFTEFNDHGHHIWTCLPMMSKMNISSDYDWDDMTTRNQGFLLTHITKNKNIATEPIIITDGFANVGGVYYRRDNET